MEEELKADQEFIIAKDGFTGSLFVPEENLFKDKAVIMLGGSNKNFELIRRLAGIYSESGITVLALSYWNMPGLPECFNQIPVDMIERGAQYLKDHGYKKIGLLGISMGAQLALLSASLLPELISSVVAVCPLHIVTQGFDNRKGIKRLKHSCWSYKGKEIFYAPLKLNLFKVLTESLKEGSPSLRSCYLEAVLNPPEESIIPVENINGPILLLSPDYDVMWPSEIAAAKIINYLKNKNFKYPVKWEHYQHISHFLVPFEDKALSVFREERKYPKQCKENKEKSKETTLEFWRQW